jgi:glycosyltransferase involved in cell wall biosynthesis
MSDRKAKQNKSGEKARRPGKFIFHLDEPVEWKPEERWLQLSGWCVARDGTPLRGIRARIRDQIYNGQFDRERPDVLAFVQIAGASLLCGFTLKLWIPKGSAQLVLEAMDPEGAWHKVHRRTVHGSRGARAGQRQWCAADGTGKYDFWFDLPYDWSKKVRHLHISGWCRPTDGAEIAEIRARIRNRIFPGKYGIARPDVAATFETEKGALHCGLLIDAVVPPGLSNVEIQARREAEDWETFFIQRVRGPIFFQARADEREAVGRYAAWIELYDRTTREDRAQIRRQIDQLPEPPLISILLPVYNTNPKWLLRAIASVRAQLYSRWELCIVDDASTDQRIWEIVRRQARRDKRLKILRRTKNGHICAASNDALRLATGEFIALLDHDDELSLLALYCAALALNRKPDLQLIYSDEDKLDREGRRCDPHFKPDWNPDLFTSQNYISHLAVYRTELVREAGGFREGFEGSQDYDLTLRCVEKIEPAQIHHIPRVLYHWRMAEESTAGASSAKPYAVTAARRAMQEHFDRRHLAVSVVPDYSIYLRAKYSLPHDPPLVSIIIPTRDRTDLLRRCIDSIFAKTDYPRFEVLVIDNQSREPDTLEYLAKLESESVRVHRVEGAFNFSKLNNDGVCLARGSLVALLNNDLEVINPDWLSEMVSHALRPEVGAVGARLWYPDNTIQHAGVILGGGGVADHAHIGLRDEPGYFARAHLVQDFSAITAACMLVRKDRYLEIGGLNEINLPVAFNDVDFCLRLRARGCRILWTPHAQLYHHESASRGFEDTKLKRSRFLSEVAYMEAKWKEALANDPCYNPNLSLGENLFTLAFPPRTKKPWQEQLSVRRKIVRQAPLPAAADYVFHLDTPPPRVSFGSRIEITGWLFHREGKPTHGLRGIVRSALRSPRTFKARRKHPRPVIGAAYPNSPEAATSGFILEIDRLPVGKSELELQVKDHEKNWRTIFATRINTVSLDWLSRMRLPRLHETLSARLRSRLAETDHQLTVNAGEVDEIKARIANVATIPAPATIKAVHLFVTSKSNLFIVEIARLVCAGFRDAGFAAELFVDRIPEEETPDDTIQIVVTPHEFYNLFLATQFSPTELQRRTRNLYLLGTEQPESDWFHSNLLVAPYARAMLDINPLGVEGYRARGLRCLHLPLGYHPLLAATAIVPKIEREIDICLLASMTDRREKFLAAHADFFAKRNCHLRLVPIGFAKTETTKSYLAVQARNALLQNSKILLNVHYSDLRYFEWHRMLVGLANGSCIITETCEGYAPLVPGKHFVMVEPEGLVQACEYYLARPQERMSIAETGRDFIRQHLTQAGNCARVVEQITSDRDYSSPWESDNDAPGEHLPEPLRKSVALPGGRGLGHALAEDVRNFFRPTERVPLTTEQASEDEKTRALIQTKRAGFVERFAQQEAAAKNGAAWQLTDNEAFRATASPAISVVVTLYNYERYIQQCVKSVGRATRTKIPGGIEILIVDDASTDRSLRHATEAQQASALPLRIVAKKFNTGLADARNVGLRLARAPYAFIMDADNLIFPRALESLYEAITTTCSAAAYSILCRFRGKPDNRRGLLSYFDWDPRMLVEHPYIDAMALFDRAQLLALGGYDNDLFKVGWFGWEDYELWLRMAAAHLKATMVPNILCLYRHHEAAMSRTTNLFEVELVRHLISRYQPLIDEYEPKTKIFGVERSLVESCPT